MALDTLHDLMVSELKDIYSAETQLVKAMPKMAKAAGSESLRAAMNEHLEQTKGQVVRLEKIFEMLGSSPRGKKCKAMEGLIEEGSDMADEEGEYSVRDAGLIAAAQRVEHYEIAAYGSSVAFATQLGLDEIANLLNESLAEEKATDVLLSELAESEINAAAGSLDGAADDEESEDDEEVSAGAAPKRTAAKKTGATARGAEKRK